MTQYIQYQMCQVVKTLQNIKTNTEFYLFFFCCYYTVKAKQRHVLLKHFLTSSVIVKIILEKHQMLKIMARYVEGLSIFSKSKHIVGHVSSESCA